MLIEQPARWLRIFYPHALWRMDKNDHSVYLTFDDGPIPELRPLSSTHWTSLEQRLCSLWWLTM